MNRKLNNIQNKITVSQHMIDDFKHQMKRFQDQINHAVIKSPADGIVNLRTYRDWRSVKKNQHITPGVSMHIHDIIADIINPENMKISLSINEADFHLLKKDMKALVRLPAFPGEEFNGKLELLGAIGRDRSEMGNPFSPSGYANIAAFNAEIDFDGQNLEFHPGMSALVEFVIKEPQQHLVLSRRAVLGAANNFYVYLKKNDSYVKTAIKGRHMDELYFVVSDGLNDGDTVAIGYQPERKSTDE